MALILDYQNLLPTLIPVLLSSESATDDISSVAVPGTSGRPPRNPWRLHPNNKVKLLTTCTHSSELTS